jgi:alpha-methylacyl-CoA racemase
VQLSGARGLSHLTRARLKKDQILARALLEGLRIIEIGGVGPGPFAGMMLADHGAEVIRVDRPRAPSAYRDPLARSRRSVVIDLKRPEGVEAVYSLAMTADAFIEGFRPGVMERIGLGPDRLCSENPRLVYGRMTGWGQTGPLAKAAGHDLVYLAISGALHSMGRPGEKPPVPLNIVGDFGAGGMLLAFGMVSALLAVQRTGRGDVIDAAISDGAALLMSMFFGNGPGVEWRGARGTHMLTGAAPFYDTYETREGGYVAVAAIEPQFYAILLELLGLAGDADLQHQMDMARWPAAKAKLAAHFLTRTRDEWCDLLEGTDACFAPVLSLDEAPLHPHNRARATFIQVHGMLQPAPAPRYSSVGNPEPQTDEGDGYTDKLLREAGFSEERLLMLKRSGVLGAKQVP